MKLSVTYAGNKSAGFVALPSGAEITFDQFFGLKKVNVKNNNYASYFVQKKYHIGHYTAV